MPRYIDADEVEKVMGERYKSLAEEYGHYDHYTTGYGDALGVVEDAPTVNALEVTEKELRHLINDVIAYIWRLEDRGCDKPEFGYDSRKALLEKLERFEKEHFPQHETRDKNAAD